MKVASTSLALLFLAAVTLVRTAPTESGQYVCPPGNTGKVANPKNCALYYDCGKNETAQLMYNHLVGNNEWECDYLLAFNDVTEKCEFFKDVNCGERESFADPCDYVQNQCSGGGCVACEERLPTCVGKGDGINAWRHRPTGFVSCVDERVFYKQDCPLWDGKVVNYNDVSKTCIIPE